MLLKNNYMAVVFFIFIFLTTLEISVEKSL